MILNLELSRSSIWDTVPPEGKAVPPLDLTDVFERQYDSPIDFLNALSMHLATEAAYKRGLPISLLSDCNEYSHYRGITLERQTVQTAYSRLPDKEHVLLGCLVESLQRAYSSSLCHKDAIYVYDFNRYPSSFYSYFGYRGGGL